MFIIDKIRVLIMNYKKVPIKNQNLNDEIKSMQKDIGELKTILNDDSNNSVETLNNHRLLTLNEVLNIEDKYYDINRWDTYYEDIIDILKKFPNFGSVLELGPYKAPFVENSDIIDYQNHSEYFPLSANKVILHDCSRIPYPIADKEYDLVIASQVLEHLGVFGQQVDVFKELARISKMAIIGLPYKWFRPFDRTHHMIDEEVFDAWQGEFNHIFERKTQYTIIRVYDFGD